MKSHYFTSKSFKYLGNRIQNESPIQGHKTVRSDFEDKIDLLRVPVYDKKKKFQKNNSKKQIQPHQTLYQTEVSRKSQKKDHCELTQKNKSKHYRYKSTVSGRAKFAKTSNTFEDSKKEQSNRIDILKTEKEIYKQTTNFYDRNLSVIREREEQASKGISQHYDSQSLLRKSSLFLLNFIKRKEKIGQEPLKNPHIAGIPNIATNIRLNHSPKKKQKYVPTKRTIVSQQKMVSHLSRIINNLPIEPW